MNLRTMRNHYTENPVIGIVAKPPIIILSRPHPSKPF
jgi:hypothetical protein